MTELDELMKDQQKTDPLPPECRALINQAIELERQCAYLHDQVHKAQLQLMQNTKILTTVRDGLMVVKEKIKDKALGPHFRSALHGHGLMKGL